MTTPFRLESLTEAHVRTEFSCGEERLDLYFRTQVSQDIRRHLANCYVAMEAHSSVVAAYYTIAATGILTPDLPPEITRRLPRYPSIPAIRIGRLAVDRRFHGQGLGGALLADAAQRALASPAAAFALIVDAKNDQAIAFYEHYGFVRFTSQPRSLFLPLANAVKLLADQ